MNDQHWDTNLYDDKHSFVYKFGEDVVSLLDPQPGERILDLGCGTGHLTQQIADAGAEVVGLDSSVEMVAQARALYPDLTFIHGDGADFHFDQPFDAVFSNAALHWIKQPEQVADCVHAVLKPGGRFVAEMGGAGNVETYLQAAFDAFEALGYPLPEHPWYFPSPGEYATLLEARGFRVTYMIHFDRPTTLDGDEGLANFARIFTPQFIEMVAEEQRGAFFREIENRTRDRLYVDGRWVMDYVRLRFRAFR